VLKWINARAGTGIFALQALDQFRSHEFLELDGFDTPDQATIDFLVGDHVFNDLVR
jgi:hypothetical protein